MTNEVLQTKLEEARQAYSRALFRSRDPSQTLKLFQAAYSEVANHMHDLSREFNMDYDYE